MYLVRSGVGTCTAYIRLWDNIGLLHILGNSHKTFFHTTDDKFVHQSAIDHRCFHCRAHSQGAAWTVSDHLDQDPLRDKEMG